MSETSVIVLAAGQGTRMKSRRAKVLHELCGVPMLGHVLRNAQRLAPTRLIVVVGRDAEEVKERFAGEAEFVLQAEQYGTGHAVQVAMPTLGDVGGDVLVLYGDTPLLSPETLEQMAKAKRDRGADLAVLTARTRNIPGRVARDASGRVARIIEAQDATPEELEIEERNTGVYLFSADLLRDGLDVVRVLRAGLQELWVDLLRQLAPRRRRCFDTKLPQAQRHARGYHELAAADVIGRLVAVRPERLHACISIGAGVARPRLVLARRGSLGALLEARARIALCQLGHPSLAELLEER